VDVSPWADTTTDRIAGILSALLSFRSCNQTLAREDLTYLLADCHDLPAKERKLHEPFRRRHSELGYQSPIDYEATHAHTPTEDVVERVSNADRARYRLCASAWTRKSVHVRCRILRILRVSLIVVRNRSE
jgi:hypothetical protein